MSYFRPQNVRKIATRSVSGLPNSTQNVSRKRGRVSCELELWRFVSSMGFTAVHQNAAIDFAIVTKRVVSYYEVAGYNGEVAERLKAAVC